jgi:hypothetical protein
MRSGVERLARRIEELRAFDPQLVPARRSSDVVVLETAIEDTLASIFSQATPKFNRYRSACDLEPPAIVTITPSWIAARGGGRGQSGESLHELRNGIAERARQSIALLEQAVRGLKEEIADRERPDSTWHSARTSEGREVFFAGPPDAISNSLSRKIFIVHGHDEGPRESVARFLGQLGLQPIILHERPNKGRTIITKFREEAADINFAVVLMTPDDIGKAADDQSEAKMRTRQNVVFELGFFIGAIGPNRVVALVKGEIERPSDFDGVVYISIDSADWRTKLGQELQAAGYEIDWNKVMRG